MKMHPSLKVSHICSPSGKISPETKTSSRFKEVYGTGGKGKPKYRKSEKEPEQHASRNAQRDRKGKTRPGRAMGNTPSNNQKNPPLTKSSHLSAGELYKYEIKYDLSIAELEYCFSRFLDLHDVLGSKDQERTETTEKQITDNKPFFEVLQSDWVLGQVYRLLFERSSKKNSVPTFEQYLETVMWWSKTTHAEKLEFVYKLINPRNDVKVTIWDLTFVLQKIYAIELKIGNSVRIRQDPRTGVLRYMGPIIKKPGIWAGIELLTPDGKNDGSVSRTRYFQCGLNHGVFVEVSEIDSEPIYATANTILKFLDPNGKGYIQVGDFLKTLETDVVVQEILDRSRLPPELGKEGRERSKAETEESHL